MTTFKNNAKYAELVLTYLDVAHREDNPLQICDVLRQFEWRFKGGSLREAAQGTRLKPETSDDYYPEGTTREIAAEWPHGRQARALSRLLVQRRVSMRLRARGLMSRVATYQLLTSSFGQSLSDIKIYSGMRSVYHLFGLLWEWSAVRRPSTSWDLLMEFTRELTIGSCAVSRVHIPTVEANRQEYQGLLEGSRISGLLLIVEQLKELISLLNSPTARKLAKTEGNKIRSEWGGYEGPDMVRYVQMKDRGQSVRYLRQSVGPLNLLVSQNTVMQGTGCVRYALSKSDAERLHQLAMAAASAIVGVCAQAAVGTRKQRSGARQAVEVTERNIQRIVQSARLVPLGDEVLVCKGYRRAYTAHLGWLAGPLCISEHLTLVREAEETAPPGVLDVEGFLIDARTLTAEGSLNACKMFKICPAPDVSPGAAMMDRIKQIGNGNEVSHDMMPMFEAELTSQILRAYIRKKKGRLKLRLEQPEWYGDYLKGEFNKVPSSDIDKYLAWEGDAKMPDISEFDPAHWKDSGLGADTIRESREKHDLGKKRNMITRLVFDEDCPMPGRQVLSDDHVIKFFIKAEGHKDPARGIFSANLVDRQAQSWMERAVDQVAREHPSYMIGAEVDDRQAKVTQLTMMPKDPRRVALYYSFDISGWSAKMPAEPQRISHSIWGRLYGGHLFNRATELNEGAYIYLSLDGYRGWFRNTHANLEGFNGKEMTMILVSLLSLSVKRWREAVVQTGVMTGEEAEATSALLFAYIDDGLSRIDLPRACAKEAFRVYRDTVIETFALCGFSVEVSKCFPSDRFAIFLNEVYLGGRHVVHGVRAAMGISAEPTERHTTLVERTTSVSTGCRGAVMAGLDPLSGIYLQAYHTLLHIREWTYERDPTILAGWCLCPRSWGGIGLPNMMQLYISGSGSAFEEGVATMQKYAKVNGAIKRAFSTLCRSVLEDRDATGVMTAPLSGRVPHGYMVDSRVAIAVRRALGRLASDGRVSTYANRLLQYADVGNFADYAGAIVAFSPAEVVQEQMLVNVAEAHPHSVFSAFARRLEKSTTIASIVGREVFIRLLMENRKEAELSVDMFKLRMSGVTM